MLEKSREQELSFLLRTNSHIKIHQQSQADDPLYADYYTLRELVDEGVLDFIYMEPGEGILLEVVVPLSIAVPETEFESERFPKGHLFRVEHDAHVEKDFMDLMD